MLLCHLSLLAVGLHDAAFGAEVLHLAVKHDIFTELALQASIEYRNLDTWLQADLLKAFLAIAQYPGLVAGKGLLEAFANHLVCAQEVRGRDALAVRRIHHDDALLGRLLEILEVFLCDGDVFGHTSCTHIESRCVDSLHVYIIAIDVVLELTFL